jgi:Fe2+ transport system protein FeoA
VSRDGVPGARGSAPVERALDGFAPGERGRILRIDASPSVTRRLMELGLVPGADVEFVRAAPLGDPLEVAIGGLHLSLRRSEAARIHVALG